MLNPKISLISVREFLGDEAFNSTAFPKILYYCRYRGISIERMAQLVGVSRQTLHKYLSGNRLPDLKTAYKIQVETEGVMPMSDWLVKDPDSSEDCL